MTRLSAPEAGSACGYIPMNILPWMTVFNAEVPEFLTNQTIGPSWDGLSIIRAFERRQP